jgi:hypothetical protein
MISTDPNRPKSDPIDVGARFCLLLFCPKNPNGFAWQLSPLSAPVSDGPSTLLKHPILGHPPPEVREALSPELSQVEQTGEPIPFVTALCFRRVQ